MSVQKRVLECINAALGTSFGEKDKVSRLEVVEWDSLKHIEIILMLEEEFSVQIALEDASELDSVDSITSVIRKYGS